jgi:GT2 family glycosyltransferase
LKVSVVIPTRNRGEEVLALLTALEAQTHAPDEIVIVDSSDTPLIETEHAQDIQRASRNVRYFHTAPGVSRQRNFGARQSIGELIFFLDDDVVPSPGFIETLAKTFAERPEYAGGMGTLRPVMKRCSPGSLLCMIFLLQHEHGDGRFSWSGMPRHPYGTRTFRDVEVLGGGLMAVRRSVFAQHHMEFDEKMLGPDQEDADFSYRLSRRHKLFFDPRAEVDHRPSPRGRAADFEQSRRYMFNFRYLYSKNFYPVARWTLPAHWWALAGMLIVAALTGSREVLRGYVAGFGEFAAMRQGRSEGIFEPQRKPTPGG